MSSQNHNPSRRDLAAAAAAAVAVAATTAVAGDPTSSAPVNVDEQGLGLRGFDPVAYFSSGVPTAGDPAFAASHDRVSCYLASAEHLARSTEAPEAYAPAFSGFCQFCIALANRLDSDPEVWRVADGQLFVYAYPDAKAGFLQDIPGNTVKADTTWPKIMNVAPQDL